MRHDQVIAIEDNPTGRFGQFGGQYVPETLMYALHQLNEAYLSIRKDEQFRRELNSILASYVGRPSPLYFAKRLTEHAGGAKIYFKREDLNHTGAHKINNTIGQCLLTKRMGKPRIIAETGAGQHGVASATAAALLGLQCDVYMGAEDVRRQKLNVFKMRALGAKVISVETGSRTLRDAINEAMRDWMASVETTHYVIGSVMGPHPFPTMVRDFQSVIGEETITQSQKQLGRLPNVVCACVGGGSNAAGIFAPLVPQPEVELFGIEAGGRGPILGEHSSTLTYGRPGVLHGMMTYVLVDEDGQTADVHSISAGLDYPGVGPEHSYWKESGRVNYRHVTDEQSLEAFQLCSRLEGIIPALETSHAIWFAIEEAKRRPADQTIVVNLSGRGDKDCYEVARLLGQPLD